MKHASPCLLLLILGLLFSACIFDSNDKKPSPVLPPAATGKFYLSLQNTYEFGIADGQGHFTFKPFQKAFAADSQQYLCDQMVSAFGKVYVSIQRTKSWTFDSVGFIQAIVPATDSLEALIRLTHSNPGPIIASGAYLYVGCSGSLMVSGDGALLKVDPATGAVSKVFDESVLGSGTAGIVQLEKKNDTLLYCVYYSSVTYACQVALVNVRTGAVIRTLAGIGDAFGGAAYSESLGRLYVGDRGASGPGIKIFNAQNDSLVAGPIATGLPPLSLKISGSTLFITTSDYQSGAVRMLDCNTSLLASYDYAILQDNQIKIADQRIFIVLRGNPSNLTELSATGGLISENHIKDNSNPVDIVKAN